MKFHARLIDHRGFPFCVDFTRPQVMVQWLSYANRRMYVGLRVLSIWSEA